MFPTQPPPPPGPPLPVGPPGMPPPPPFGPPPPVGAPVPGVVDGEGTTLDEGVVVVGVVLLLGALLPPPPQPTAKTSMAAPPNTANAVRASDLIRLPTLIQSFCCAYALVCVCKRCRLLTTGLESSEQPKRTQKGLGRQVVRDNPTA